MGIAMGMVILLSKPRGMVQREDVLVGSRNSLSAHAVCGVRQRRSCACDVLHGRIETKLDGLDWLLRSPAGIRGTVV